MRWSDLAGRLASWGHQVKVLTALPNYPSTEVLPGWEGRSGETTMEDGAQVARLSLFVPRERSFLARMTNYLSFAAHALARGEEYLYPCDVLMMESPPLFLGMAAVPLARRMGARFVVNVSDLWPRTAVEMGIVRPGLGLRAADVLEKELYRSADLVMGQTEGIIEDIRGRFPEVRTALFPNGVDCDRFRPGQSDEVRAEMGWSNDEIVFGYAGVLGHAQALGQVLDAAAMLRDRPDIRVVLVGDGPERKNFVERVRRERLDRVSILPRQPADRMPAFQSAFDVGLVTLADRKVFAGARPSKCFEIMASGRPVLLCARGEAARVVESAPGGPAGKIVPPERPAELAEAMRDLARDQALRETLGRRGRALVERDFERRSIAVQVESLLEAIL